MDDVRLTATNPADSSIVPVACNDKGEILLEEPIEGPPGQDGQDGQDGEDGKDGKDGKDGIQLPPDPYEGALLGWLNSGLAWIGTPPIDVPEGVFGPITSWSPNDGLLTVRGSIPPSVGHGVYIYQVDESFEEYTKDDWLTNKLWRNTVTPSHSLDGGPVAALFDADLTSSARKTPGSVAAAGVTLTFTDPIYNVTKVEVGPYSPSSSENYNLYRVNNQSEIDTRGNERELQLYSGSAITLNSLSMRASNTQCSAEIYWIKINGKLLVDSDKSLNMRVNQLISEDMLLGSAEPSGEDFTIGKYLKVPSQRIAPWVLYEGDPTSRIDYLRQTRD